MQTSLSAASSFTNLHTQASASQTSMVTENMEGIEVIEDGTSSICATVIGHNHDESTSELHQDTNLSKEVEYRLSLLNNLQSSAELPSSMISSSGMAADTINQPVGQQYESNLAYNDSVHANESSKESIFLARPNIRKDDIIRRLALGNDAKLGYLYDAKKDEIIPCAQEIPSNLTKETIFPKGQRYNYSFHNSVDLDGRFDALK
uniref:Uncharacterized protein n=1 Tax=Ditylenchus dipsaci TaxID=166011 RepID=A0A915E4B4_9BILA